MGKKDLKKDLGCNTTTGPKFIFRGNLWQVLKACAHRTSP